MIEEAARDLREHCSQESLRDNFLRFEGTRIVLPERFLPDSEFLKRHREKMAGLFRGLPDKHFVKNQNPTFSVLPSIIRCREVVPYLWNHPWRSRIRPVVPINAMRHPK